MARRLLLKLIMPATMEERLDELLAKARETGRLANQAARMERAAENARTSDRARFRRLARDTQKALAQAEKTLAGARSRFLATLPAEEAAP